jgi:1-deoxy-D-xylulose-5-phosphate reductoisomerase
MLKVKKRLAILGSTGSIGTQALQIVAEHPQFFSVEVLSANNNYTLLIEQAKKFNPNVAVIANENHYNVVNDALTPLGIKVYAGSKALEQVLEMSTIDMVLLSVVGFAGLKPALAALNNKKPLALANKESLVVAGEHIIAASKKNRIPVIPVDSEHSAIFQCLNGENGNNIEKIILTASGGPFRKTTKEQLYHVTINDALKHPSWNMGDKISIDSATLMNKGFEVMEAHWLFNLDPSQIEIVVHPQSVIHSLVFFEDGSVKAQMSHTDMRIPIQYALTFPARLKSDYRRLDFSKLHTLNFEPPDYKKFRNLALAYEALKRKGNLPCILNASNEIAVEAFLQNRISFLQIPDVIEKTMNSVTFIYNPEADELTEIDAEARTKAKEIVNKLKNIKN